MGRLQTLDYEIPESMQKSWQEIVNLLAQITHVPTTLIMRIHPDRIEVNTSSETQGNPYRTGDAELLGNGLYC
ncbi:bifunctional diguanylate cyclase/phosphodiesterase, partial [Vibrio diabolicus]